MTKTVELRQTVARGSTTPPGTFPVSVMAIGGGTSTMFTWSKTPTTSMGTTITKTPFSVPNDYETEGLADRNYRH